MSKTTFVLGMTLSIVLHTMLLLPAGAERTKIAERPEPTNIPGKVTTTPPPKPQKREVKPPPERNQHRPELQRVVEANAPAILDDKPGDSAATEADESLPALNIVWSGPEEMRRVAHELGMKVVAVGRENQIVAEVALRGTVRLVPFHGALDEFSNRVRSIPRAYFGDNLLSETPQLVVGYWILVPVFVDQQIVEAQRTALRRRGLKSSEVHLMEAKYVLRGANRYELVITTLKT
jgi:hypothetical protein